MSYTVPRSEVMRLAADVLAFWGESCADEMPAELFDRLQAFATPPKGSAYIGFACGQQVVGTYEELHGVAYAVNWSAGPAGMEPNYEGETTIHWDNQRTVRNNAGELLVVLEDGQCVGLSEVKWYAQPQKGESNDADN